jgi:large-conductance mechanosensitive channel
MLESFREQLAESEVTDRGFGIVMSAFFLFIAFVRILRGGEVRWWAAGISVVFLALALAAPRSLRKLKTGWLILGLLLGRIVNPIVLSIFFFLVVTPTAILMRLSGRDPLRLRRDPAATTYWEPKTGPESDMTLQF